MRTKLLGKTIKIYTKKGYFYRGEVLDENDLLIILFDYKSQSEIALSWDAIDQIISERGGC